MAMHGAELDDRDAVQQLINKYSDAVTRADYAQMETVFATDAVWESPALGFRFDSARAFIDFQIEGSAAFDVLIQTASASVVEMLGPDRALATTNIREMIRGTATSDGPYGPVGSKMNVDQYGLYFDEISKIAGEWKFTRRVFVPIFIASGAVIGNVIGARPLSRPT